MLTQKKWENSDSETPFPALFGTELKNLYKKIFISLYDLLGAKRCFPLPLLSPRGCCARKARARTPAQSNLQ
jgi:hypothetical protein